MRYTILFLLLFLIFSISCNKQKFSTTPSLRFKSVNTRELHNQQILRFTLSYTDAEGDLTDADKTKIYVQEIVPACANSNFIDSFPLPSFPATKDAKGDIDITFGYNTSGYTPISPQCQKNDTAIFRFALKDNAQHISDTISSPSVILFYP